MSAMESLTPVASPGPIDEGSVALISQTTADAATQSNVPQLTDYIALGCLVVNRFSSGLLSPPLHPQSHTIRDDLALLDFPLRNTVSTLKAAKWIRVYSRSIPDDDRCILRVFVLPQDVARSFFRTTGNVRLLQAAFELLLLQIDTSTTLWNGRLEPGDHEPFDRAATPERSSLFYIFNTLPSPAPTPTTIANRYSRSAAKDLLGQGNGLPGLKTRLYPYQARSAALMLQRESTPDLVLDPRLELRQGPDGRTFYYCPRDGSFLKHPRLYESVRGGILSETMGLGKTLMCISVIVATKGHLPKIPGHYIDPPIKRSAVGSLSQMTIASANRHSVPFESHLDRLTSRKFDALTPCLEQVAACPPMYRQPVQVVRFQRNTTIPPPLELTMCKGTIIVVPRNLVHQWELEFRKHVHNDCLRTLVMDSPRKDLPSVSALREYDVVLFSRQRFEREIADGKDALGRRAADGAKLVCRCPYIGASRKRDCTCLNEKDVYQSPLKKLHWLRLIIDEGHAFHSARADAVQVVNKLVRAERRWIVSGTPARHRLFGVEVEAGSDSSQIPVEVDRQAQYHAVTEADGEDVALPPGTDPADADRGKQIRRSILRRRKAYIREQEMDGAAQHLGQLATNFLKLRPFAASELDPDKAEWADHVYRHESRQKTHTSFSLSLRRILESVVIKTQPEDVEKDIVLPPLQHRTVYLEPCFYDKLTINLFVLVISNNAVTSERKDQDYLFHENGAKARNSLIRNLRQSAFYWTGFTTTMVADAVEIGSKYLAKDGTACFEADRHTLTQCLTFGRMILQCRSWQAFSRTNELGAFVDGFPEESADSWTLDLEERQTVTGISHLLQAQSHVNSQLLTVDAFVDLAELGKAFMVEALVAEDEQEKKQQDREAAHNQPSKLTSTTATSSTDVSAAKRHYQSSSTKRKPTRISQVSKAETASPGVSAENTSPAKRKREISDADRFIVPANSPVRVPSLTGTASAKLSYLIDQVLRYQKDEKLLIFYDGDDIAYYLAQYLDLLHSTYLIYAKSLTSEQKAKYIVAFDENPRIRVLIMDVHCGAEGLNVNKASRVYFINPCYRPNIEAQAIKRSHRIGQTRPVHVETLVLKGTIEEAMFRRARLMTNSEHQQAKELADDKEFAHVIQNARSIPMTAADFVSPNKMAPLTVQQQIFGRDGRNNRNIKGIDIEPQVDNGDGQRPKKRKSRAKPKAMADEPAVEVPAAPIRSGNLIPDGRVPAPTGHQMAAPPFSIFGGG